MKYFIKLEELVFLFPLSPPNSQQRLDDSTEFNSVYLFANKGLREEQGLGKMVGRSKLLNILPDSQVPLVFLYSL